MFDVLIPCFIGIVLFFSICLIIFYIFDSYSKEEMIENISIIIVADIIIIISGIVLMYVFSIIALIVFILAAIWLVSNF